MELMGDSSVPVQDTTAWTIGRICDLVPEAIDPQQHLANLIKVLLLGLQRDPRVASNCTWVSLFFLSCQREIRAYFLCTIFQVLDEPGGANGRGLRISAFRADSLF